jgi:predicted Holliday junction resolvase-like endonuclease
MESLPTAYVVGGLVSAIITLCVYIKVIHSSLVKNQKESSKEHSERTKQVTEAMVSAQQSMDRLALVNEKLYEELIRKS